MEFWPFRSVLGTQRGGVGRGEKGSLLGVGKGPGDSEDAHRPGATGLAPQLRDELILGNRNNLRWRREPGIKGARRSGDRGSAQQVFLGGQGQASTPPALSAAFPTPVVSPIALSTLFPGIFPPTAGHFPPGLADTRAPACQPPYAPSAASRGCLGQRGRVFTG